MLGDSQIFPLTGRQRPRDILGIGSDFSSHFSRELQCMDHPSEGDPDAILDYCAVLCGWAIIAALPPAVLYSGSIIPPTF
jgi:hypothetical protein